LIFVLAKAAPKVTKISSTQNSTTLPSTPQPFTIPANFLASKFMVQGGAKSGLFIGLINNFHAFN
jgi:hypothetical protein